MTDFSFLQNPSSNKWVVLAPKRAKRPDQAEGMEPPCPFEGNLEEEVYSFHEVKVVKNKFPFAPIHEIVIHSKDHHKNFDELTLSQNEDIFRVYRSRFQEHEKSGQVYIFHNQGKSAGESLPHPHTQIAVIPRGVFLDIPIVAHHSEETKQLPYFYIFCPSVSQWPDEVWIVPQKKGKSFGEIDDMEIKNLAFTVSRLVQILDLRHGSDFPFNFYIYPAKNWYLRIIPRVKVVGGFEVGTGVFVNTQSPVETLEFIKEHFDNPDFEKIKSQHLADYKKTV